MIETSNRETEPRQIKPNVPLMRYSSLVCIGNLTLLAYLNVNVFVFVQVFRLPATKCGPLSTSLPCIEQRIKVVCFLKQQGKRFEMKFIHKMELIRTKLSASRQKITQWWWQSQLNNNMQWADSITNVCHSTFVNESDRLLHHHFAWNTIQGG